jgi:hypothetical protein
VITIGGNTLHLKRFIRDCPAGQKEIKIVAYHSRLRLHIIMQSGILVSSYLISSSPKRGSWYYGEVKHCENPLGQLS